MEELPPKRIDHEREDRDQRQDEEAVDHLDLSREKGEAEPEVLVHQRRLGLERPRLPVRLIPERPEARDEDIDDGEAADRLQPLLRERVLQPRLAGRRDDRELVAAEPEEERRGEHRDRRHSEREPRPVAIEEDRAEVDRDRRAGVDREVEVAERALDEVLVLARELVAHVGRDTRLDPARSERDEEQPEREPAHAGDEREDGASGRIGEREGDDRAELPPEDVRDDRADEREEVRARLEERVERRRLGLTHAQELRHVDREDRVDAVVAKALGELVRDDERDALGHPVVALGPPGSEVVSAASIAGVVIVVMLVSSPGWDWPRGRAESLARARRTHGCAPPGGGGT